MWVLATNTRTGGGANPRWCQLVLEQSRMSQSSHAHGVDCTHLWNIYIVAKASSRFIPSTPSRNGGADLTKLELGCWPYQWSTGGADLTKRGLGVLALPMKNWGCWHYQLRTGGAVWSVTIPMENWGCWPYRHCAQNYCSTHFGPLGKFYFFNLQGTKFELLIYFFLPTKYRYKCH